MGATQSREDLLAEARDRIRDEGPSSPSSPKALRMRLRADVFSQSVPQGMTDADFEQHQTEEQTPCPQLKVTWVAATGNGRVPSMMNSPTSGSASPLAATARSVSPLARAVAARSASPLAAIARSVPPLARTRSNAFEVRHCCLARAPPEPPSSLRPACSRTVAGTENSGGAAHQERNRTHS
jgi:hypothetical protein